MDLPLLLWSTSVAIAAAPLHEVTHAAAARLLGFENVGIDYRTLSCEYDVPQGTLTLAVWLVGAMPLLIGLAIVGSLFWGLLDPPMRLEALPLLYALIIFAFGGGLEDLRLTPA